jgi:hypothetical protein
MKNGDGEGLRVAVMATIVISFANLESREAEQGLPRPIGAEMNCAAPRPGKQLDHCIYDEGHGDSGSPAGAYGPARPALDVL